MRGHNSEKSFSDWVELQIYMHLQSTGGAQTSEMVENLTSKVLEGLPAAHAAQFEEQLRRSWAASQVYKYRSKNNVSGSPNLSLLSDSASKATIVYLDPARAANVTMLFDQCMFWQWKLHLEKNKKNADAAQQAVAKESELYFRLFLQAGRLAKAKPAEVLRDQLRHGDAS